MTVETRTTPAVVQPKTVGDVLRHAALIIEERGWCQRSLFKSDGRVCMVGAIAVANGADLESTMFLNGLASEAWTALERHLHRLPACFNDRPGRTAAEVTAALRAAADEADR